MRFCRGDATSPAPHPSEKRLAVKHDAFSKRLEFRCVVAMACDDEVIPLQERIEAVVDDSDFSAFLIEAGQTGWQIKS